MSNFSDFLISQRLKKVSVTELENAISETIIRLIGTTDDPTYKLDVSVTSLDLPYIGPVKIALTVNNSYELFQQDGQAKEKELPV